MTVHPQSNRPSRDRRMEPAPVRYSHGTREGRLPLHPSGPGGVRRIPLRGAQPSTPSHPAHSTRAALEREFNPAVADCGLQGTATSPSSTATRKSEKMAEGVGFEPTARLPLHGISSAAPSATRPPLRSCSPNISTRAQSKWRRGEDLNPRGTYAPIRFRVGRLQPGSATPPDQPYSRLLLKNSVSSAAHSSLRT